MIFKGVQQNMVLFMAPVTVIFISLIIALSAVTLICGIILLVFKLKSKTQKHPKIVKPISIFLIICGLYNTTFLILYFGKIVTKVIEFVINKGWTL
ncbi:hypothetical protein SDC9_125225 [bioreactor metagenome]|uniref:Uncharacterized protein n=1 Tax=bioreactor metagenome TaxID=1076179 RepID=A0A645CMV2_9ZZZZ